MKHNDKRGFTLVELSIVLVIIGLLSGGILGGQSLIHAAELRGIATDYQSYSTATQTFRDKYFAVPGDMVNATAFWGKSTADCNAQTGTAATPGTCNGNGNGRMEHAAAAGGTAESFRAWQQLALAGLIPGTYTGNSGSVSTVDPDVGSNVPASKIRSVGWGYGYYDNSSGGNAYSYNYDFTNWLVLGNEADNVYPDGPFMPAEDAWNIDSKLDDGKPGYGKVQPTSLGNCTDSANATDRESDYLLTNTSSRCALIVDLGI
ncbi:MAG: hypothetical protein DI582_08615 [Azospirillum brasilense]|nr:MAG: hypothetical protein DI582_08615 [Azospirillum brasilense]